ncbi:hypothetical protein HZB01_01405 [Candidatus Woesearchaeota archaeon]|nr:hypothetical protein [Candidatus Woesearchaeota archaeon]
MAKEIDTRLLKEIGLTSNEVTIYLTLIKSGSVTVNVIAEKAGLHRQGVYDALDRLLEKGFVGFLEQNSKKYFHAISPEYISEYLQHQVDRFKALIPTLIALPNSAGDQTTFEVFKGRNVHKIIYNDVFKTLQEKKPKEVLISGVEETRFREADPIALEQHVKHLKRFKMTERVLIMEGDTDFVEGDQTTYRWIPREFFSPTPTFIYGDKIGIIIWSDPNYLAIIKNKELAESYKRQFNFLWKIAKKPHH